MSALALVVVGGGEHARVVIEAARTRPDQWTVLGFADPLPCTETASRLALARLGTDDEVISKYAADAWFVLGVGMVGVGPARAEVAARYGARGLKWASVVHQTAWVSPSAHIRPGAVVLAGAVVNSGAVLGHHCVVNTGAIIEHDVHVGAFAQVGPGAMLGGGSSLGEGAYLGLGAAVRDHVAVGARALVGMGAVVARRVEEGDSVVGVPARTRGRQ